MTLAAGEVVVVEPGEPHTFLGSSPDYFHFVVQTPGMEGQAARAVRIAITHADLGLSLPSPLG